MKKYQQLEKLFGRELKADEANELAMVFGKNIDFLSAEAPSNTPIQPFNNMPVKSILSGKTLKYGDFEHHWQQFIVGRQEILEDKMAEVTYLPEYSRASEKLYSLFATVSETMGEKMFDDLRNAVMDQQVVATYLHYNKGYLDGIKFALMIGQL